MSLVRPCLLLLAAVPLWASAQPQRPNLFEIEAVSINQQRNTAQFPNDPTGTRFSLRDLIGEGNETGVRVSFTRALTPRQELRFLYAPLSLSGTGALPTVTNFQGRAFAAGVPTQADYRFDSYRATWRYRLIEDRDWTVKLGFTAKIRDARIALAQPGVAAEDSNVGLVPLAHAHVERRLGERLTLVGDLDGLAGGPGYAIDIGLRLRYRVNDALSLSAGWRMLDGGADNREQYAFARFQFWTVGLGYRF
jgi:hypothetical protein